MKSSPVLLLSFASAVGLGLGLAPGCDNSTLNQDPPLPGVGPIGAGGATAGLGGGPGAGAAAGAGGAAAGAAGVGGAAAGAAGDGGASGTGGSGAACPPGSGTGAVRFANLLASSVKAEFCARKSGEADYNKAVRQIQGLGDMSRPGLAYAEVSVPIAIGSGGYDIKAIDASAADCTAPAIHELAGLCLHDGDAITIPLMDGAMPTFTDLPPDPMRIHLRFIHGLSGLGPLDVGLTASGMLPTKLQKAVFTSVPFAGTSAPGMTFLHDTIDAQGYGELKSKFPTVAVGAWLTGTTDVLLATTLKLPTFGISITVFGIGLMGDATYPQKALVCDELSVSTDSPMLTSCAVAN